MNKAGVRIRLTFATFVLLHIALLVIGLLTHKLPVLVSVLNSLVGLSIIIFWALQELRITQRVWLVREIAILFVEILIAGSAIYCILENNNSSLIIFQYIVFGLHFLGLLVILALLRSFGWKVS